MGQYGDPMEQQPMSLDDLSSEWSLFSLLADHVIKAVALRSFAFAQ